MQGAPRVNWQSNGPGSPLTDPQGLQLAAGILTSRPYS